MASRYSYGKVVQPNPSRNPQNGTGFFGYQCIYNHTNKTIFVSSPSDRYDANGQNWIQPSGSVYVYLYDETNRTASLIQKISQPNVNIAGTASKRHGGAGFGIDIDTYGEWLIIGCSGDKYTEEMDGLEPKLNNNFEYQPTDGSQYTVVTDSAGSVYFYKWNGTTYDYVNKVRPPLYQDFGVIYRGFFPTDITSYYHHIGMLCGNGSAFGTSVSIDKSDSTSITSSSLGTKKLVAIGAPNATCIPSNVPVSYHGPYGGVWLAHYNTSTLKWELLSYKINSHSYGGRIPVGEQAGEYGSQNQNPELDPFGIGHISSSYDVYDPPSSTYIRPNTSSYSKVANEHNFGLRVCIGYYGNHKLTVYNNDFTSIEDSFGIFQKEGNTHFYDLIFNPSNPQQYAFELRNPYGNRQFYMALDKVSASLSGGYYAESILGYSTFTDDDAVADSSSNVEYSAVSSYNVSRGSNGYCNFTPISGTSLASASGTTYTNDFRFHKIGPIGKECIKQSGRLLFVSSSGMQRASNKIFPDGTSQYTTAYSSTTGRRVSSVEDCDCLFVFDTADLSQLKNKAWILAAPNTWKRESIFSWTGGFGKNFDIYQESSTQWIVVVPYAAEDSKTNLHSEEDASDYIYTVNTGKIKTDIYRLTYDGTTMSVNRLNIIDGKIVNGNSANPSFANDISVSPSSIMGTGGSEVLDSSYFMRRMSFSYFSVLNFISPAIIKNTVHDEYHVAESWVEDNDGTVPTARTGSFSLTSVQGYEINGSSFLQFCE